LKATSAAGNPRLVKALQRLSGSVDLTGRFGGAGTGLAADARAMRFQTAAVSRSRS